MSVRTNNVDPGGLFSKASKIPDKEYSGGSPPP